MKKLLFTSFFFILSFIAFAGGHGPQVVSIIKNGGTATFYKLNTELWGGNILCDGTNASYSNINSPSAFLSQNLGQINSLMLDGGAMVGWGTDYNTATTYVIQYRVYLSTVTAPAWVITDTVKINKQVGVNGGDSRYEVHGRNIDIKAKATSGSGIYYFDLRVIENGTALGISTAQFTIAGANPVASFDAFTVGLSGTALNFTNSSSNATSCSWNFGDGNTSTADSPSHTFSAAGNYTVVLTATNTNGSTTASKTITVMAASTSTTEKIVDGNMTSASNWVVATLGTTTPTLTWNSASAPSNATTALRITKLTDTDGLALYQPVALEAGKKYYFNCLFKDLGGNASNVWSQVYITNTVQPGNTAALPINENTTIGQLNSWIAGIEPVGYDGSFYAKAQKGASYTGDLCSFTPTVSGMYYVILRIGTWWGNMDIAISKLTISETIPTTVITTQSLTLSVDMNGLTVDPAGVFVTGSFNTWSPTATQMTDPDHDGIYTVTIPVTASADPYQYKFINGNAWGKEEYPVGDAAYRSNRLLWVTNTQSVIAPIVKFGYSDAAGTGKPRVACIGDSNTEGAGISAADRFTKTWPMQLRDDLNHAYFVDNMGVSGATLMALPEPWGAWTNNVSNCYKNNIAYNANKILINLGTNDSKTGYWGTRNFETDYTSLVNQFRLFSSNPDIYLVTPIKSLSNGYGIDDNNVINGVIPAIRNLSKTLMLPVIDWYSVTSSWTFTQLSDGVHANVAGLGVMAQKAAQILTTPKPVIGINQTSTGSAFTEYRWYLNGTLITGATASTYTATQSGVYNLAVRLSSLTEDVLVSAPLTVTTSSSVSIGINTLVSSSINQLSNQLPVINYMDHKLVITEAAGSALSIYDLSGSLLRRLNVVSDYVTYSISGLSKGIYVCKVESGTKTVTRKIIL